MSEYNFTLLLRCHSLIGYLGVGPISIEKTRAFGITIVSKPFVINVKCQTITDELRVYYQFESI